MDQQIYFTFVENYGEKILYCFLDEEEKKRLESLNYQIYYVTTPQEYNACLQSNREFLARRSRSEQYNHPSCDNNLSTILNNIVIFNNKANQRLDRKVILNGFVDDIYIYEDRIMDTQYYGKMYGKRISPSFEEKLKQLSDVEEIMLIAKVITVNNQSSHIQPVFINIFNKEIQDIHVVDTSSNHEQELFIKTLLVSLNKYFKVDMTQLDYSFYFERNNFTGSLQKDERMTNSDNELNLKGYCGAWTLFFIYNFIRFNAIDGEYGDEDIFDGVYRFLNKKSDMLTAMIMHWWDNVVRFENVEIWDKIPNISYVLPQQSDIVMTF